MPVPGASASTSGLYVMTIREFRAAVAALFPRGVPSYRHLDSAHPAFMDPVGAVAAAAAVTGGAVVVVRCRLTPLDSRVESAWFQLLRLHFDELL